MMKHGGFCTLRVPKTFYLHLYLAVGLLSLTFLGLQFFSQKPSTSLQVRLQEFPAQVGDWEGMESRLNPSVVTLLGLDDWILRQYQHPSKGFVWFYIGFLKSLGALGHHSPQVCYPAQGWELLQEGLQQVNVSGEHSIAINRLLVKKDLERQLILYWYQWGEKVIVETPDAWGLFAFKLRALLSVLSPSRPDTTLVRISAPVVGSVEETVERAVVFIQAAFPLLRQQFALEVSSPRVSLAP
jgi:EpsI family protein